MCLGNFDERYGYIRLNRQVSDECQRVGMQRSLLPTICPSQGVVPQVTASDARRAAAAGFVIRAIDARV